MDKKLSTEGKELQIIPFERNVPKYIDEIVQLDTLCLREYGETWTKENFMLDLPQKGQLSKLAISRGNLIGYLICSSYRNQKGSHCHRIAVHPEYRELGIAQRLWEECVKECLNLGISGITVEAPNSNTPAKNLYAKLGFRLLKGAELKDYLSRKGKEQQIARFNNDMKGFGAYFIEAKKLLKRLST